MEKFPTKEESPPPLKDQGHWDITAHTTPACWNKKVLGLTMSHKQASPVDDVERVKVPNGARHLCSVEPGPGLQEPAFPLEMEEELGERAERWWLDCSSQHTRQGLSRPSAVCR